jgi:hypothetical protein
MEEDEKAAGYAEAKWTKCSIVVIQEEQGRGNDERKTKMQQTSGSSFFTWQANGEKVGENAGRQPDAIRFDVIG